MDVRLKVLQGRPQGQYLRFPAGEFVFGRGPECHVRPNSEWVSRQHCLLRVGDKDVIIRDLGSTNGTLVNGCLLVGERSLQDGDRVQLGPLVLEVSVGEGTSPETAVHDTCLVDQSPTAHGDPPGNATREMRM